MAGLEGSSPNKDLELIGVDSVGEDPNSDMMGGWAPGAEDSKWRSRGRIKPGYQGRDMRVEGKVEIIYLRPKTWPREGDGDGTREFV